MQDSKNLSNYSIDDAIKIVKEIAGDNYSKAMETVLRVAFLDKRNLPGLGFRKSLIPLNEYINKWINAYLTGYNNRPSQREAHASATYPDYMANTIFSTRVPNLTADNLSIIENGHSLSMTIENLVGDLLEEYLSIKLAPFGWYCCWGCTIDAVDFCKEDGTLLQIKTSDNSENSSSKQVRNGTQIQKWFRRFSKKTNSQNWRKLNLLIGKNIFTEDEFKKFVIKTVQSNPNCIYVASDHPLALLNK